MRVEIINEQWASLDDWTFEIVWKPIPGFPLYEASNIGQIRNAKTKRIRKVHSNSRTNKDTYYCLDANLTGWLSVCYPMLRSYGAEVIDDKKNILID